MTRNEALEEMLGLTALIQRDCQECSDRLRKAEEIRRSFPKETSELAKMIGSELWETRTRALFEAERLVRRFRADEIRLTALKMFVEYYDGANDGTA